MIRFKSIFYQQLIFILLLLRWSTESNSVCNETDTTSGHMLFLITFDAGLESISNNSPSDFGFRTDLLQVFKSPTNYQTFGFYNNVPYRKSWHHGAMDHTENDFYGYMYLVDFNKTNTQLFNYTVNNLCIGLNYEFSAYLANVNLKSTNYAIPKIHFIIQTTTDKSKVLSKLDTRDIDAQDSMMWIKYGLSFIATDESVDLLMISGSHGHAGNDLAIDDISLRVCHSGHISHPSKDSFKVCYDHHVIFGKILFLITFGSGVDSPSKETPCSFNFSTSYEQLLIEKLQEGTFTIVNHVYNHSSVAYTGELDHTANDTTGYMIIIDLNRKGDEFFRTTFTELCLGIRYEVSVYMANIIKKKPKYRDPNIRLMIRTIDDRLIAELHTGAIASTDLMIWHKFNLSFIASSSSVFLVILSNLVVNENTGNDLAIDDIELKVSDDVNNRSLILSVTFDSGTDQYLNKSASYFGFRTTYEQVFGFRVFANEFALVNSIPDYNQAWHINAQDHTLNDENGYMYIMNVSENDNIIFQYMINGLFIGFRYEFSAYLANLISKQIDDNVKPCVVFEIRSATKENLLLAQLYTDDIPDYDSMTWLKYSLSFIAISHAVVLHMISLGRNTGANDLAADDIEFRLCSTDCISPLIILIPNSSVNHLQFRQNQDIFISSKLQFYHGSQLLSYQWTIIHCSPICSNEISLPNTTYKDLMIESHKLSPGRYEFRLTIKITLDNLAKQASVSSVFIEILISHINTNLVSPGRLNIKHHSKQNLLLDPGNFSTDPIRIVFFAHKWLYQYYCRIYDHYNQTINEEFRLFNDPNQTCFSKLSKQNLIFNKINSLVNITADILEINRTYQFMIHMIHLDDSTLQSIGYLFVEIENIVSRTIFINCLISTICSSIGNNTYLINRNTQLTLVSTCFDNCPKDLQITWEIYQDNGLNSWNPYNSILSIDLNSPNLMLTKEFFDDKNNKQMNYWRFQVIYLIESKIYSNKFDMKINDQPSDGSCTIHPLNGTIDTLFTISCSNWIDNDGIKDYSFYAWTKDPTKTIILNSTVDSNCQVHLPASADAETYFHIYVHIRDRFNSITKYNLSSILLFTNLSILSTIIADFESLILENKNSENVEQLISSLSNIFNDLHEQQIEKLIQEGIHSTSISVSSLNEKNSLNEISETIDSDDMPIEIEKQLIKQANTREKLVMYIMNLSVSSFDNLTSQSAMLSDLTQATNQLTSKTSTLASEKCHQLSKILEQSKTRISFENIQSISTNLLQCASNVMTGINGPLQGRTKILNVDSNKISTGINNPCKDYDDDEKQINLCYQKEIANTIRNTIIDMISSITTSLNVSLGLNQSIVISTNSVYFSLEKISTNLLNNRTNDNIRLLTFTNLSDSVVLLRSMIEPLSFADNIDQRQLSMKYSRSISFSILNEFGQEISLNPIEILIPRDPKMFVRKMFIQNITNEPILFNYYLYNLQINYSIHFELRSFNENLTYFLIYQFDQTKVFKKIEVNGWNLLCSKNQDNIYTFYLNNNQTLNHQTILFGIRELNVDEQKQYCMNKIVEQPKFDQKIIFSSNYEIRTYASACFYLDKNNKWKSNGMIVGSETNHYQTQCLSTYLPVSNDKQ